MIKPWKTVRFQGFFDKKEYREAFCIIGNPKEFTIKKVESTHGTPPAAGIASFRNTTTNYNIP